MRILEINTENTWRGGERQTLYTLEGLTDLGERAELLCKLDRPLFHRSVMDNHIVYGVSSQMDAFGFLARHGSEFDLLHAQTAKAQSLAILSKPFHRRPVLYTRRVDFVPKGFFTSLKYRLTNKVVAISMAIQAILTEFGVKNVDVIPSAVKPRVLNKTRAEELVEKLGTGEKKIIGVIAAMVPHKDPLTLVEAVRELRKLRDDFVVLHFGDGELREKVEVKIREYGLQDCLLLQGYTKEVEDFYSIFDVFLMTSYEEGLGSSVLDAFAYRVPVVATLAGGLKETVQDRGTLCGIGQSTELAEALSKTIDGGSEIMDYVEEAYEHVIKNHSIHIISEQYVKVFRKTITG